jgi:agmatine/peptidylarginine deiminase
MARQFYYQSELIKLTQALSFRVEEEGVVGEVIESETEEEDTEEDVDARKEKEEYSEMEAVEFAFPETDAEKADWAKSYEEMKDKVDNLMDAIADIKERLGEGDSEEVEMTEELLKSLLKKHLTKTVTTTNY